ncbi:MAG TPA: T9SS type A sorting domain-containing protein [Ignavibacteria bacterium]
MKKIICKFFVLVSFLLIYNLTFNIENCISQWVQMSNGIGNDKIVNSFAILGNNIFAGTYGNGVYLSSNNGTNWIQTSLNNQIILSLLTLENNIFAGTYQYGVYLSTNNGTNWTQTSLNNQLVWSLVSLGNNIFAGTLFGGVYISTNNGTIWSQTDLYNKSANSLAILGNNIFAGTVDSYNPSGIYLSTNNGTNWTQTSLNNQLVWSLATLGNNIFAGTYQYGVYLSTDNGLNWTQTTLINKDVYSLATIENNIFAGTYQYGVYLSNDNGTNWVQKNQGFNVIPLVNALLIANNYIFAGTNNKSIWRRDLSEIIGMQNISTEIPSGFSLSQNYPNPFNPVTKIKFDIPKSSNVKLTVYDITGKEISILANQKVSTGSYEVEFNGENNPSGVYFYRLTTDEFSETKKMILMK